LFDGNAQGLRVITKLQYLNDLNGLNLTFATLGTYLKYPNGGVADKKYIGTKKHGIYYSENVIFDKIVTACNLKTTDENGKEYIKRHPLSFLVEAADTICYRSMDIEDGWSLGWFSFKDMIEKINTEIRKLNDNDSLDICQIIDYKNFNSDKEPNRKKMVDFRVKLIQYFVNIATNNYLNNLGDIDKGIYSIELLDQDEYKVEKALKKFNEKYIFTNREIQFAELTGSSVLKGLLDILIGLYFSNDELNRAHVRTITSKTILRTAIHEQFGDIPNSNEDINCFEVNKLSDYQKLRIIVDFVSGMTDQYAVKLYQRLSGQKL
jgi:dGTPase